MTISEILDSEQVRLDVEAASKKRALEALSNLLAAADPELNSRAVFDRLLARERQGNTGLGEGVAIPHSRIPNLKRTIGALIKVHTGVDYDAPDGRPVDILFGLLVPEEHTDEHLELLSHLASAFDNGKLRSALRAENSPKAARDLVGRSDSQAA